MAPHTHTPKADRYRGVTNGSMKKSLWTGTINADLKIRHRNFKAIRNARLPRRTFYGSMTDLWHEALDIDGPELRSLAEEVEGLRNNCRSEQVVMFLTKRPERMLEWQKKYFPKGLPDEIWVGTTVENQKLANERVPLLNKVKAKVRYLSCEPMTEKVKLRKPWLRKLEWIIVGGESGPKARSANPDWFRSLRDQSVDANIPFHFKQWGEFDVNEKRIGKKVAGRTLDGRTWDEHPNNYVQIGG